MAKHESLVAIVSGLQIPNVDFFDLPSTTTAPSGLSLPALDELARLVEAYVLHDRVLFFHEPPSLVQRPALADFLATGHDDIVVAPRRAATGFNSMLSPFLSLDAIEKKSEDVRRALRALRNIAAPGGGFAERRIPPGESYTPTEQYTPDQWIEMVTLGAGADLIRAEIALSEQLAATYYSTAAGANIIGGLVTQFGLSAARVLSTFTHARGTELAAATSLLSEHAVEWSPPLLLAYAVASADTYVGFIRAVEDLRRDSGIKRLRRLIAKLSDAEPHGLIEYAQAIDAEMKRILGKGSRPLGIGVTMTSIPAILGGNIPEIIKAALAIPGAIERLTVRRHLHVLRRLHKGAPLSRQFYSGLRRVFGTLTFNEEGLRRWMRDPRALVPPIPPEHTARHRALNKQTRRALLALNNSIEIRRARRP